MTTGSAPTRIGWLVLNEPEQAKVEILEALERSRGRLARAAVELGVSRRHLLRYNWQLDLWPQVDAVRDTFRANHGRVQHNGGAQHGVPTN
jgi:hypothetical protein